MESQIILATKQLAKKYGDIMAVEQINLNVKKGHIYGMLGRNGAGLSSLYFKHETLEDYFTSLTGGVKFE